ncbi:MAG: MMPL family transporter, partial [Oligoflexales bacterium]|nr:MMPL family transporter [Oligoflexales bacterium]
NPLFLYGKRSPAVVEAFSEVGLRVILAGLTMIFGFTSFIMGSYLSDIRDFGIFMSVGIAFSLIVSIFFVPALLSFIKISPGKDRAGKALPSGIRGIRERTIGRILGSGKIIVAISLMILALGAAFIPKIERRVDLIDFLKQDSILRKTTDLIDRSFGGSKPLNIIIEGDLQNPGVLKEMIRLEKYLEANGAGNNPMSVADIISEMNDTVDNQKTIPDDRARVANLFFLLEGQDILPTLINSDKNMGVVTATLRTLDVPGLHRVINKVDSHLNAWNGTYAAINIDDLPEASGKPLLLHRGERTAEMIAWDAARRNPGTLLDPAPIRRKIEEALRPSALSPEETYSLYIEIRNSLPAKLQENEIFLSDLKSNLIELSQKRFFVHERELSKVPGIGTDKLETFSIKMSEGDLNVIGRNLDKAIIDSQFESFFIALVFIFILLTWQLRSWLTGLLGLIPIIMTVVVMFGVMGLTGIPLTISTVLVASIGLGIGIDYSIHFCVRFKRFHEMNKNTMQALVMTLETTGTAIIVNALAVCVGFATLLFAEILPLKEFGFLVSLTMIGCGLGALTLLPVLILKINPGIGKRKSSREKINNIESEENANVTI